MKIQEFELLGDLEKEDTIWEHGTYLVNIDENDTMYDVYSLFDFYVCLAYQLNKNLKAQISVAIYPDALPVMKGFKQV